MTNDLTYCIIGSNGFLDRHLLQSLIQHDNINLRLLTRKPNSITQNSECLSIFEGDLLKQDSLNNFLTTSAVVINLAYLTDTKANLIAAKNLANACNEKKIKQLLHISTAVVAGKKEGDVISEKIECNPISPYEKNKFEIEKILTKQLSENIILTILRPTAIFGIGGKNLLKIVNDFQSNSNFMRKLKLTLLHDSKMHLVAVDNVVAAILFLIKHPASGNFIIANDETPNNSYGYIIQVICQKLNIEPRSFYKWPLTKSFLPFLLKLKNRSQINPMQIYSCKKLEQAGFVNIISFEEALQRYIQYILSNGNK